MHNDMSKETKEQILARLRRRYLTGGLEHKSKLLDQAVELLGYHRKAAIRALGPQVKQWYAPGVLGRPRSYHPESLLPILKPIWFAAFQPCGSRLHALLPEWLPAYEEDHRRLDGCRFGLRPFSPAAAACMRFYPNGYRPTRRTTVGWTATCAARF